MIDKFLSLLAPHLCCGCGNNDGPLCSNCKYDITSEHQAVCLSCRKPCDPRGLCNTCKVPYDKAWYVGKRRDVLQRLIGLYKFQRLRAAYRVLGDLLIETLPQLPPNVIIVPVPTVASHIRERGYDHILLIARYVAGKRQLGLARVLVRATHTKQRQASAATRQRQAKGAFTTKAAIIPDRPYLLIDDIMTTGATLKYAAQTLKQAGATHVWVAVIARQSLD